MREWNVEHAGSESLSALEELLNKQERDGWTIFAVLPSTQEHYPAVVSYRAPEVPTGAAPKEGE